MCIVKKKIENSRQRALLLLAQKRGKADVGEGGQSSDQSSGLSNSQSSHQSSGQVVGQNDDTGACPLTDTRSAVCSECSTAEPLQINETYAKELKEFVCFSCMRCPNLAEKYSLLSKQDLVSKVGLTVAHK